MNDQFSRTRLLIGEEGIRRLQEAKVAVFGIGGVGGYAAEAFVPSVAGMLLAGEVVKELAGLSGI